MSWFNRLFTKNIAGSNVIVLSANGNPYVYDNVKVMYDNCPYIRAIVDYKAACLSNGKFRMFKVVKNGEDEELFDTQILNLLNNPNPFQSGQDLFAQTLLYDLLYSKSYIRQVKGISSDFAKAKALWSLPPNQVKIVYKTNVDIYSQFEYDAIIDHFEFSNNAALNKLYSNELLYSSDYNLGFVNEISDFRTLQQSVANLMAIQESRGVIIHNRGAIGMLSQASGNKDAAGIYYMKPKEKDAVLNDYKKLYGLQAGQSSVIIPDIPMTWQSMILNIKDLQLDESALTEFNICCDLLGVPRSIFDDKTAFNNQIEVKKKLYNDSVIPYAEKKTNQLNKKFNLKGEYFTYDFSHLPFMQEDEKTKADTEKAKVDKLDLLYKSSIISKGTYKTELGYITEKSDFNTYYNEENRI